MVSALVRGNPQDPNGVYNNSKEIRPLLCTSVKSLSEGPSVAYDHGNYDSVQGFIARVVVQCIHKGDSFCRVLV